MGRRNKEYSKTLHQQAYDRLTGMQALWRKQKGSKGERDGCGKNLFRKHLSILLEAHEVFYPVYQRKSPGVYHAEKRKKVCE